MTLPERSLKKSNDLLTWKKQLARLNPHFKSIVLFIVLIAIVLVVLFGELPNNSLFWREVQNSGHTLLFAIAAVLILQLLRDTTHFFRQAPLKLYVAAGVVSLLVGVMTEIMQLLTHSDASKLDVIRDLAGIIAGLGLYAGFDPYLRPYWLKSRKRTGIVVLSLCVFTASMFPLVRLSAAYIQRESAFPVIVDLTAKWSEAFIQTKHATVKIEDNQTPDKVKKLASVRFNSAIYPGVSVIEPYPDWSFFDALSLDIYSQQAQTFDLVLSIHDQQHDHAYSDRFNRRLTVKAGENHFHIPLHDIKYAPAGREMDMTKVSELTLFAVKPVTSLSFYLSMISLE